MSKLAVITGADGGMGKEITRAVAEAGYHVIMLCYTLFKGEERKNQMILETGNKAGTMSTHLMQTEDGLERTVAVNYVAPFLLTMRLLPLMGKGSRIVNMVSCTYSLGHITSDFFSRGKSGSFWRIPIYSNTKLDCFFRPCIRTPKEGAATAIHLLLDEEVSEVTGQMFASCKPKKVKDKFMNHPQAKQLWEDTEKYIEQLRLEESII